LQGRLKGGPTSNRWTPLVLLGGAA
jgi:hypothetical protein